LSLVPLAIFLDLFLGEQTLWRWASLTCGCPGASVKFFLGSVCGAREKRLTAAKLTRLCTRIQTNIKRPTEAFAHRMATMTANESELNAGDVGGMAADLMDVDAVSPAREHAETNGDDAHLSGSEGPQEPASVRFSPAPCSSII
jgi:hypothetical protein